MTPVGDSRHREDAWHRIAWEIGVRLAIRTGEIFMEGLDLSVSSDGQTL